LLSSEIRREKVRACLRHISCSDWERGQLRSSLHQKVTVREPVPAAVLVPMVGHPEEPTIILTRRTDELQNHAGEISFPGGRVEPEDSGTLGAALREAREELGLEADKVEVLGCLPPYDTLSGFRVRPFVGWLDPPVELRPDEREVAEVFEVPLGYLLDPANHREEQIRVGSENRAFYVLEYEERRIWGATAGILVELAGLLAES